MIGEDVLSGNLFYVSFTLTTTPTITTPTKQRMDFLPMRR
jgi:hypothetical protein